MIYLPFILILLSIMQVMRQKINTKVDTTEIDAEINNYTKQLRHNYGLKDRLIDEIDGLDWEDKHYERRKGDLDKRLDQTYNRIDELENELEKVQARKDVIEQDKITGDNIYKILLNFENIFSSMDDLERKQFIELLIDEIQIHPEKQENGQWLKSISFRLPIIDQDFDINGWVNNTHVSTWLEDMNTLTHFGICSLIVVREHFRSYACPLIDIREHLTVRGNMSTISIYVLPVDSSFQLYKLICKSSCCNRVSVDTYCFTIVVGSIGPIKCSVDNS